MSFPAARQASRMVAPCATLIAARRRSASSIDGVTGSGGARRESPTAAAEGGTRSGRQLTPRPPCSNTRRRRHRRFDRRRGGLAKTANRRVAHRLPQLGQQQQVGGRRAGVVTRGPRGDQPLEQFHLPHRADSTRHALAARFVAHEARRSAAACPRRFAVSSNTMTTPDPSVAPAARTSSKVSRRSARRGRRTSRPRHRAGRPAAGARPRRRRRHRSARRSVIAERRLVQTGAADVARQAEQASPRRRLRSHLGPRAAALLEEYRERSPESRRY